MTHEENCSYINSQVACALIEAMGMQANNQDHTRQQFSKEDFDALIGKYGIYHNAVITTIESSY